MGIERTDTRTPETPPSHRSQCQKEYATGDPVLRPRGPLSLSDSTVPEATGQNDSSWDAAVTLSAICVARSFGVLKNF